VRELQLRGEAALTAISPCIAHQPGQAVLPVLLHPAVCGAEWHPLHTSQLGQRDSLLKRGAQEREALEREQSL
jgi:hypothetical protein